MATEKLDHTNIAGGCIQYTANLEKSLSVSIKSKHSAAMLASNCNPTHFPQKREGLYSQKNLYTDGHSSDFVVFKKLKQCKQAPLGATV